VTGVLSVASVVIFHESVPKVGGLEVAAGDAEEEVGLVEVVVEVCLWICGDI
jgi:hypothetical protein